jgi:ubiquinone/menaquinone biosynthesis C-methylase UbiE
MIMKKIKHKKPFSNIASYVDILWHKSLEKQLRFIKYIIKSYFNKPVSIIDAGCGTGRITYELAKLKEVKNIVGFDNNLNMLKIAQQRSHPKIKFVKGDLRTYYQSRKVDLILCLYTTFNYLLKDEEIIQTLKNFRKCLKRNGMIVLDLSNLFYQALRTEPHKPIIKIFKWGSLTLKEIIEVHLHINKGQNIWIHEETLIVTEKGGNKKILKEKHELRFITSTEMKCFAEKSNLKVRKIFLDYNIRKKGSRLIFLLSK